MSLKHLIVLFGAVAFATARIVPVAPAAPVLAKLEDFDAAPQYSFAYDVQDSITGDSKAQYESREGDVVQGSYSLIEADGTRRIVDYTADPVNGFNAVVSREPAVAVAPLVAKPAVAAPIVAKTVVGPAVAAPVVGPAVASPIVAPAVSAAKIVRPVAPARIVAPAVAAPIVAGNVYAPAAPVAYTLPRAVATRLSSPFVYPSPYAAYTL